MEDPAQDLVYVTDQYNNRVQVFDLNGTFVRQWSVNDLQRECVFGVVISPTRDLVFVGYLLGGYVHAYSSAGTFLFAVKSPECEHGRFWDFAGFDIHPTYDLLFVVETGGRVQVFDFDGSFVCKWGSEFKPDVSQYRQVARSGEFYQATGISVHPTRNEVLVCDYYGVQVFSLFDSQIKRKRRTDFSSSILSEK